MSRPSMSAKRITALPPFPAQTALAAFEPCAPEILSKRPNGQSPRRVEVSGNQHYTACDRSEMKRRPGADEAMPDCAPKRQAGVQECQRTGGVREPARHEQAQRAEGEASAEGVQREHRHPTKQNIE